MYKQVTIIYNSYSGLIKPQFKIETLVEKIQTAFDCQVDLIDVANYGDLELGVKEASLNGSDLIIGCGGDGTAHKLVNGIMKSGKNPTMAILPFGTVNDFARVVGMSDKIDEFVDLLIKGDTRRIDLGLCNDQYFINVVAAGAFTDIGYVVPQRWKRIFGKFAYYLFGAKDVFKHLNQSFKVRMVVNGEEKLRKINLFTVSNSNSIGGFRNYARPTEVDDGYLYLMYMEKVNVFEAVGIVAHYLATREFKNEKIKYHYVKTFEIECEKKMRCDIDGEKGHKLPIKVNVVPSAINLIVNSAFMER